MIHRSLRLTKGVFDLVGRGDGIICPHCRNFAPATGSGNYKCQRCGAVLKIERVGEPKAEPRPRGRPQKAKRTIPSGNLSRRSTAAPPPGSAPSSSSTPE